jgi:hypothetical protein
VLTTGQRRKPNRLERQTRELNDQNLDGSRENAKLSEIQRDLNFKHDLPASQRFPCSSG